MKYFVKLLAVGLMALTSLAHRETVAAEERSPDGKLIDQLARSGSDLGKLHRVDFLLHFPTRNAAERAELQLIGLAFETRIEPGKSASDWLIQASKVMYPSETDLAGLRDKLTAIAAETHGTYEGWHAKVASAAPPLSPAPPRE